MERSVTVEEIVVKLAGVSCVAIHKKDGSEEHYGPDGALRLTVSRPMTVEEALRTARPGASRMIG